MKCPDCKTALNHHAYNSFEYYFCPNCRVEKVPRHASVNLSIVDTEGPESSRRTHHLVKRSLKKLSHALHDFPDLQELLHDTASAG